MLIGYADINNVIPFFGWQFLGGMVIVQSAVLGPITRYLWVHVK